MPGLGPSRRGRPTLSSLGARLVAHTSPLLRVQVNGGCGLGQLGFGEIVEQSEGWALGPVLHVRHRDPASVRGARLRALLDHCLSENVVLVAC